MFFGSPTHKLCMQLTGFIVRAPSVRPDPAEPGLGGAGAIRPRCERGPGQPSQDQGQLPLGE